MKRRHQKIQRRRKNRQLQRKKQKKIRRKVELKEPQDYYPIPEEPEGELIDYDAISRTYKTGDKQYTTVYGGYVGTYKNEDGDTELVDNTLVKPEEADTPASEEAQEASSASKDDQKEEKT